MFFFCVGDAVSQAAQSFLPSVIGRPSAAQRLGRQLMTTGVFVGIVNCAAAGTPEVFGVLIIPTPYKPLARSTPVRVNAGVGGGAEQGLCIGRASHAVRESAVNLLTECPCCAGQAAWWPQHRGCSPTAAPW